MEISKRTSNGVQTKPANSQESASVVEGLYARYWPRFDPELRADILRQTFNLELVGRLVPPDATVCDIGGGWGIFACALAKIGYRAILIDDFGDRGFFVPEDLRFKMQRDHDIEVLSRDVIREGVPFPPETIDVFTTFDTMEHWHNSPKKLFRQLVVALKPGGHLIIGVPNSANLRKRLSMLSGKAQWTSMEDWYEFETFRGHVREPSVADLGYISRDLGLELVSISGRNFMAYGDAKLRPWMVIFDRLLRLRPSLCSNLYMIARKPQKSD
jgi:SAM-dependent methyltransferase